MFGKDFYPTPPEVIAQMLNGYNLNNRVVLEPSAGKGNLVDYLKTEGANVISCEINPDLRAILQTKCTVIENDFLQLTADKISHVNFIVMNPPFSADEDHILHAWEIAPAGCTIISLCNYNTVNNPTYNKRAQVVSLADSYGLWTDLGQCFGDAERGTGVQVAVIKITKPAQAQQDYEGFFLEDDAPEQQANALMSYNVVRDIVQRYVGTLKLFERQMSLAVECNEMAKYFGGDELGSKISKDGKEKTFNEFKKGLQKSGWKYIFNQMNLEKHSTKGLKEDINKFVEEQTKIPFTMRNIYQMIDIVLQTTGQRMDKALLEVFDKVTARCDDNRFFVEGWKTNSHYLINRRFIVPSMVGVGWSGQIDRPSWSNSNFEMIEDFVKALCYVSGDNYSDTISLEHFITNKYQLVDSKGKYINDKNYTFDVKITGSTYEKVAAHKEDYPGSQVVSNSVEWGKWFEWGYFRVRCYKKGTAHFEFKDENLWGKFNQRIAKLKGFPLYEAKKPTSQKEKKEYVRREQATGQHYRPTAEPQQFKVLFTS